MRIMLAILVAAFVALAWAIVSAARHIRHVRTQRRKATEAQRFHITVPPTDPERAHEPTFEALRSAPPPPLEPFVARHNEPEAVYASPVPRFPLSSHRTRIAQPALDTVPEPEAIAPPPVAPLRRPPASVTPSRNYASFFNNDEFGDLSDPEPQRFRERRQR